MKVLAFLPAQCFLITKLQYSGHHHPLSIEQSKGLITCPVSQCWDAEVGNLNSLEDFQILAFPVLGGLVQPVGARTHAWLFCCVNWRLLTAM